MTRPFRALDDTRTTRSSQHVVWRHTLCAMLCAASLVVGAQPAAAQDEGNTLGDIITANQGLIITLVVLTTASTVTYITQGLTDRLLDRVFADTQRYMNNNAAALSLDISVGAGGSIDDLATLYGIPPQEHIAFRERVHDKRDTLMPLVSHGEATRAQAEAFVTAVLTSRQLERYR